MVTGVNACNIAQQVQYAASAPFVSRDSVSAVDASKQLFRSERHLATITPFVATRIASVYSTRRHECPVGTHGIGSSLSAVTGRVPLVPRRWASVSILARDHTHHIAHSDSAHQFHQFTTSVLNVRAAARGRSLVECGGPLSAVLTITLLDDSVTVTAGATVTSRPTRVIDAAIRTSTMGQLFTF